MLRVFHGGKGKNPTNLCHGFDLKDARHDWVVGEVTLKKGSFMVTFLTPVMLESSMSMMRSTTKTDTGAAASRRCR